MCLDLNKPFVFLDIDGVVRGDVSKDLIGHSDCLMSPQCVKALNAFSEQNSPNVVISSVRRKIHSLETIKEWFKQAGCNINIVDTTPVLRGTPYICRGNEIWAWIDHHVRLYPEKYNSYLDFNRYVILDDSTDMLLNQQSHFLWVDRTIGFTPIIAHKASLKLRGYQI